MADAGALPNQTKPTVLFVSRGNSHLRRLPVVMNWAAHHGATRLTVLLCPEDDYSEEYATTLKDSSKRLVSKHNDKLIAEEGMEIDTKIYVQQGMLHSNIKKMCRKDESITVLFVGKAVLDFRLSEIKELKVPFFFMD